VKLVVGPHGDEVRHAIGRRVARRDPPDAQDRLGRKGELGKRIYENVSKEAWAQWLKHQTMLVNENRLSLADPRARKYLAEQMERHFFGGGADVASGYVPPKS